MQVVQHTFHLFLSPMVDPIFTSFGSLIIDDIRYPDGTEERNILGGAGIYAIYGTH